MTVSLVRVNIGQSVHETLRAFRVVGMHDGQPVQRCGLVRQFNQSLKGPVRRTDARDRTDHAVMQADDRLDLEQIRRPCAAAQLTRPLRRTYSNVSSAAHTSTARLDARDSRLRSPPDLRPPGPSPRAITTCQPMPILIIPLSISVTRAGISLFGGEPERVVDPA